jgi:hypothetical protein
MQLSIVRRCFKGNYSEVSGDTRGKRVTIDICVILYSRNISPRAAFTIVAAANTAEQPPQLVSKLFKPFPFNRTYKHYLNIILFCESTKQQEKW